MGVTRESTKWPYTVGIRATESALAIRNLKIIRTIMVKASKV
jgi:hypothetical protein